eukprot:7632261-Alexandrium_andersonii.AAC.1
MLRRAGAGVSFGRGHSQSGSWWLPGPQQSAQRAEIFAIFMLVTRLVWAPVHILSDSAYACGHLQLLLSGAAPASGWAHYDLWHDIWRAVQARG